MKLTIEQLTRRFLRKTELGETTSLEFDYQNCHYMLLGNAEMVRVCLVLAGEHPEWPEYQEIGTYKTLKDCITHLLVEGELLGAIINDVDFEDKTEYQHAFIKGDYVMTSDGRYGVIEMHNEEEGSYQVACGNDMITCREETLDFDHREEVISGHKEMYQHFRSSMGFCCE